ncbi:MAG TPA: Uma2 family endonuclease [Candidatus Binatia bacterium]|nr:Uma2 family endonuclease [Candidatus Binatia bacterium]
MKPARRPATYEDLLAVPDNLVAEIVDGELFTSPRPAAPHAIAAAALGGDVLGPFNGPPGHARGPGGWWILMEPELHFGPDVVVPDFAGWRRERLPRIEDVPYFTLAPDWVCEVASPSTAALDRGRKMGVYARASVPNLWLVDPLARTVEVYRLTEHHGRPAWLLAVTHVGGETVRIEPFDAIELELARWWLEAT